MIHLEGSVGYLSHSKSAIFVSTTDTLANKSKRTAPQVKQLQTDLNIAPWGEDNRFPQNVVKALEACGVAQSTLKWKACEMWGGGLVYGRVVDIDADGNEVFQVAKRGEFLEVDKFFKRNRIPIFFAEFALDYWYFNNCFPELILSTDRKKIAGLTHFESCDVRYKQMSESGKIDTVYISKLWGLSKDQFVKFDKDKSVKGPIIPDGKVTEVDNKYVLVRKVIDRYFPLDSLKELVESSKTDTSFVLPINFPSPNKTYYQLASWDGARLSGWIEIASRIPNMIKVMYEKAFRIKYHIEIPTDYFASYYGKAVWDKMDTSARKKAKEDLLEAMDNYLSGDENAHKTFISYFATNKVTGKEEERIKITVIDDKNTTAKDLLTSTTANTEIMIAMNVNPNIHGAAIGGGVYAGNQGGSNVREGKLQHDSSQSLDRQMVLEVFNLIRDFNEWGDDLEFRFKDTVLLTLDKGKQTETSIS
jgi:hypothetical protein